ncbi:phage tail protein [Rubrivivax rivuli]|uniref:Phage tail protein n=1 Tax=Rubrivivax rivuli TaxID=1862385 RepID=A0A437RHG4_9BURK|nr:phage tail protein [Rubrivivax rivuli]RVU46213.1 phage tail protein [Rubrivivax rivuli]
MATMRDAPYGAFNYLVSLGDGITSGPAAGFSEVSGLGSEVNYSEYRAGNDLVSTARKLPNTYKQEDVVLKRGVIGHIGLWQWLNRVRQGAIERQTVTITLLDEARNPVLTYILRSAQPKKWVGPTLAGKGGGEVAMEELHLVHEGLDVE